MRPTKQSTILYVLVFLATFLWLALNAKAADTATGVLAEGSDPSLATVGQNLPTDDDDYDYDYEDDEDEESDVTVYDPLSAWNTVWYHFNDKFYFWLLKPVAKGYKAVLPTVARTGVKNFFHNLTTPIRFTNCLLQGKGNAAGNELGRFVVNSTLGVLGFGEVATKLCGKEAKDEDFGQTLGHYNIGNGFYIIWPFLGPSTVRDSIGLIGDSFLDPVSYIENFYTGVGVRTVDVVNGTSFRLGDYEALKEAALDPYISIRNAYIQNRAAKVAE